MELSHRNDILLLDKRIHYAIILVVCFFAFFLNNQIIPADLMESRNLATAQEMVREGNYLTPTMNGELRLEKPPLPTWIAAAIEMIAPGNLVAQRCAAGLIATVLVFFLYFIASHLTRNRVIAFFSSLVLATCFNIVLMGRTATWDIYCHSFMLGGIYFLIQAFDRRGKQWGYFLLAGLFLGLSFLSKGPVSFYALLLPFLISYIYVYRPSVREKRSPLVWMIVICLFISFWWMAYNYIFHQDMAVSVAQKESSSWLNHNVRPWYYYWQFPAEFGIWALFVVTAIIYYFLFPKREFRKEYQFAVVWLLSSLILLSLIPEKKTRYLLPILIPGAMAVGIYLYHQLKSTLSGIEKNLFRFNSIIVSLVIIALPVALYLQFYQEGKASLLLLIIGALACWTLAVYLLKATFDRRGIHVEKVFLGIVLCMIIVLVIFLNPIGKLFINNERHSIRELRDNTQIEHLPFYYNEQEELRMELVYEADQTIRPLDATNNPLIYSKLPFVFISGAPIEDVLKGENLEIERIGVFDNNWRAIGHKRYNNALVREVAIVKRKQHE